MITEVAVGNQSVSLHMYVREVQLTYVARIAPSAGDKNAVSKAMGDPEKLFGDPGKPNANSTVQKCDQGKRTYVTRMSQRKHGELQSSNVPIAPTLSGVNAGTIFENMRQGKATFCRRQWV